MKILRENRSLCLTLAALGGIVLLTAVVGLALTAVSGRRFYSGEYAPYPYSWTERRNGTIDLELDGRSAGVWIADSAGTMLQVSVKPAKQGLTRATLSPTGEGRTVLSFILTERENCLAEAAFLVEIAEENGKLSASISDHQETAWQTRVSGGGEYPFTVESSDLGNLVIHITDAEIAPEETDLPLSDSTEEISPDMVVINTDEPPVTEEFPEYPEPPVTEEPLVMEEPTTYLETPDKDDSPDGEEAMPWEAYSSDESVVSVLDVVYSAQGVDVFLEGRVSGMASVTVSKQASDLSYVFTFQNAGYSLLLTESRMQSYTPYVPPTIPGSDAMSYT